MTLIDLQGKTLYLGNDVIKKAYLGNTRLYEGYVFDNHTILTPEMISGTVGDRNQRYIGTATHLIIDDSFPNNNLNSLFRDNQTLKSLVILTNKITYMNNAFRSIGNQFDFLFINASNVTNTSSMFRESLITTLDLSSFDTSNVTNMNNMFQNSQATTGYARTQADADKFNASSNKPVGLTFVVKGS